MIAILKFTLLSVTVSSIYALPNTELLSSGSVLFNCCYYLMKLNSEYYLDFHSCIFLQYFLFQVWLHKLTSDQSSDKCLYYEEDGMFSLYLYASESKQYLFVTSESKNTRFIFYLDISKQDAGLQTLTPRVYGIDTSASHRGNHFFIKRRSDEFYNSELVACPVDNVTETVVLLPHRER